MENTIRRYLAQPGATLKSVSRITGLTIKELESYQNPEGHEQSASPVPPESKPINRSENEKKVIDLRLAGSGILEIVEITGLKQNTVANYLRKAGFQVSKPRPGPLSCNLIRMKLLDQHAIHKPASLAEELGCESSQIWAEIYRLRELGYDPEHWCLVRRDSILPLP